MRRALAKFLAVAGFVGGLVFAIGNTAEDSAWLVAWFLLFFFVGVPMVLLSIRDVLLALFAGASATFRAWLLLHVCAAFAACVGLALGYLARASGHPKAELHQWLVFILPALVYLAPVLLAVKSGHTSFLAVLAQAFRRRSRDE
jgi:hypothetical protein